MTDETEAKSVSEDHGDDDDLLHRLKAWFREDRDHRGKWMKEAKEAFDIIAGEQWSQEDKRALEDQRRPALTFNRAAPVIDAMTGSEVSNRQDIRYIPRTEGDEQVNEVLSEAARFFRDECDAEHEESEAFRDAAICGEGWTETRMDYAANPEGDVVIEKVDPLEMYPDSAARKANYADARRVWRAQKNVPIRKARALFKGRTFSDRELDATWASIDTKEDDEPVDVTAPRYQSDGSDPDEDDDRPRNTVTLIQCQWYEEEDFYKGAVTDLMAQPDPATGEMPKPQQVDLSPAEHKTMTQRAPAAGKSYRGVKMQRRIYKQAWIGSIVLEEGDAPCKEHFSFNAITGKLDRNKGMFYGMTRAMKDPQQWANKWLSQALHILNSQAKGGIVAEEGIAADEADFEDSWASSDAITYVKKGTLTNGVAAYQAKPQASFPPQLTQLMEMAITSIRDVTGVNAELLGSRNADQPASLEYQRRQAGTTILASFFDSLRRYRKRQGRVLMYMMQTYVPDGRLIRIVGDEGAKYVPFMKDPAVTEYDVIVDESPSSPNQKELTWAILQPILPLAIKQGMPPEVMVALLEMSPLPASGVDKLKKAMDKAQEGAAAGQQEQQQQAMQAQQAALEKLQAEVAKLQADATKSAADARQTDIETDALIHQVQTGSMPTDNMPMPQVQVPPGMGNAQPPMM